MFIDYFAGVTYNAGKDGFFSKEGGGVNWIQETISPWIRMVLEKHPMLIFLPICIVWLTAALIMKRRKKTDAKTTKQPKQKNKPLPVPSGGYRNFNGEIWYPDGRYWNQKKQKWETSDYRGTEQSENNGCANSNEGIRDT